MNKNLILLLTALTSTLAQAAPSAQEIMEKNEDVRELNSVTSSSTLTVGDGKGAEKIKKFTWWRKLTADGVHFNTLTRFHEPAEIRGEGILFLEHSDDANDILLYLPTFKKTRRVERNNQSGSFMGSEFSYSDIAVPHVEDFKYKIEKTESCPNAKGVTCWVVESTAKREATMERTGYSKSYQWVRQDNFVGDRATHYDREGKLWKEIDITESILVDPKGGKWMSMKLAVKNVRNGKYTKLEFSNVKANIEIQDAIFTQRNLEKP